MPFGVVVVVGFFFLFKSVSLFCTRFSIWVIWHLLVFGRFRAHVRDFLALFCCFIWLVALYLLSLHIFDNSFCYGILCLFLTLLITVAWTTTHKNLINDEEKIVRRSNGKENQIYDKIRWVFTFSSRSFSIAFATNDRMHNLFFFSLLSAAVVVHVFLWMHNCSIRLY